VNADKKKKLRALAEKEAELEAERLAALNGEDENPDEL
jgi:hypothetical protein